MTEQQALSASSLGNLICKHKSIFHLYDNSQIHRSNLDPFSVQTKIPTCLCNNLVSSLSDHAQHCQNTALHLAWKISPPTTFLVTLVSTTILLVKPITSASRSSCPRCVCFSDFYFNFFQIQPFLCKST